MKLSLGILVEALEGYKLDINMSLESAPAFDNVNFFPTRQRELNRDYFYVGRLSEILLADWREPEICCLALRDRMQDEKECPEIMKNLIVVNSNCDLLDIFALMQETFMRIERWYEEMSEYIIQNRSIQEVLCLSEGIIGNYITISDSALGLVAYTTGLECDCPVTNELVKNGYHGDRAVAIFKKYRMMEQWKERRDVYINESRHASPYPNVCKVIHYNNSYFAHVVMICNKRDPTPGVVALFRLLVERLMVCFEKPMHDADRKAPNAYDALMLGLINDDDIPPETISERAHYSGLPLTGEFRFLKIAQEDAASIMQQRMAKDIQRLIPEARVTHTENSLLALFVMSRESGTRIRQILDILEPVMEKYMANCGVSNLFYRLTDLRIAHEQAEVALKYGRRQAMMPFAGSAMLSSARIYSYESYYPSYLICGTEQNARLARSTEASQALDKLYAYDRKHGSNCLELLFTYLSNERRATETANAMHMHRNNVIYRISRIEEIIGMDLSNSGVRFRLLLAYQIFTPGKSEK